MEHIYKLWDFGSGHLCGGSIFPCTTICKRSHHPQQLLCDLVKVTSPLWALISSSDLDNNPFRCVRRFSAIDGSKTCHGPSADLEVT